MGAGIESNSVREPLIKLKLSSQRSVPDEYSFNESSVSEDIVGDTSPRLHWDMSSHILAPPEQCTGRKGYK